VFGAVGTARDSRPRSAARGSWHGWCNVAGVENSELVSNSALERAVVRSEAFLRSAPKPAILGAVVGVLALAFMVRRANKRRRQRSGERGETVLGVVVKSAVSAAIATIPKVYFVRLAKSALHHEPDRNIEDWRLRPTMPETSHSAS
jgi:hypothetical protein